jgi:hypothetical protein
MRWLFRGIVLAILVALGAARVTADTLPWSIQLTNNTGAQGYSSGNGGEFQLYGIQSADATQLTLATQASSVTASTFQVFCVEYNEEFYPGGRYWVQLDVETRFDKPNPNGFSPLTPQAAYLFDRFWNRNLDNYDFNDLGAQREVSAQALQLALWYLQGEDNYGAPGPNALAQAWIQEATNAVTSHQWSGIGNVRVLHLWTDSTDQDPAHAAQDQLVEIPTPPGAPPPAPLPSTLLGGLVLLALVASMATTKSLNRRRREMQENR